jgi:hypothetical protein
LFFAARHGHRAASKKTKAEKANFIVPKRLAGIVEGANWPGRYHEFRSNCAAIAAGSRRASVLRRNTVRSALANPAMAYAVRDR